MIKFKSQLLIAISYFDEIFGPQILDIYPTTIQLEIKPIKKILDLLIDLGSTNEENEWYFLYSDKNFASQNVRTTYVNPNTRGGLTDLLVSLILHPTYFSHISAMAQSWNSIFELNNLMRNNLEFKHSNPEIADEVEFTDLIASFYHEIKEQFQYFLDSIEPNAHKII